MAGVENEKSGLLQPQIELEKKFGQSPVFVASTVEEEGGVPAGATPVSLLKEAIHVISCGYEDKTKWGKEVHYTTHFLEDSVNWQIQPRDLTSFMIRSGGFMDRLF